MGVEVARLLVTGAYDKGSSATIAKDFEASLKNIEKKAHKLPVGVDTEQFQKNMKEIRSKLEGEFKNVNLNGILNGIITSQTETTKISKWLKETEKVLETFRVLSNLQEQLGKRGQTLELLNVSQLNQLLDFYDKKDFLNLKDKINKASEEAQVNARSARGQYYYGSKNEIEQAVVSKKILSGESNLGYKTASILGINYNDDRLKDANVRLELQNYAKMNEMIRSLIQEKQELGEIKTTEDAEKNLRIMYELSSSFQQLQFAEGRLSKIFGTVDADGNLVSLIDDSKLLSNSLKDLFTDINFDELGKSLGEAEKQYVNMYKSIAQAAYDSVQKQLLDKVDAMIGKSVEKTVKKSERAQGEISKKREQIEPSGTTGASSVGAGVGDTGGVSGGTGTGAGSSTGSSSDTDINIHPDGSHFISDLQEQINGQYVTVDVKPNTEGFADTIKNSVGKIDLGSSISKNIDLKNLEFNKVIKKWQEQNLSNNQEKPELGMLFNNTTGQAYEILNKQVAGLPQRLVEQALASIDFNANSMIHSHPNELFGALSFDDILRAIQHKADGIIYEYVASINDISALDISKFTSDDLSKISEYMKSKGYTNEDGGADSLGWVTDEIEVFDTVIKDNVSKYINIVLEQLRGLLKLSNIDDGNIEKIIQSAQSDILKSPKDAFTDFDSFYDNINDILSDSINQYAVKLVTEFAEGSNRVSISDSIIDQSISASLGYAAQEFIENSLIEAISKIRPDLNIGDVYKKVNIADFLNGASLFEQIGLEQNGDNQVNANININVDAQKIRSDIEGVLTDPFDINLNPKAENIRSNIENQLEQPLEANIKSKPDSVRQSVDDQLTRPFVANISGNTTKLEEDIYEVTRQNYKIDILPSSTLKDSILDILSDSYKINIDANNITFGGNAGKGGGYSPSQAIADMVKADAWMKENFSGEGFRKLSNGSLQAIGPVKERAMFFSTTTGHHTNPMIFDNEHSIASYKILDSLTKDEREKYKIDAQVHTHPEERAYFSIDNFDGKRYSGDFQNFLNRYIDEGIATQVVAAQKDVQIFDVQKFMNDHADKFFNQIGDDLIFSNQKTQNFLGRYSNKTRGYMADWNHLPLNEQLEVLNGSFKNTEKPKIDFSRALGIAEYNEDNILEAIYNGFGIFDKPDMKVWEADKILSNMFWEYLQKNTKNYDTIGEAMGGFIQKGLSNVKGQKFSINSQTGEIFDDEDIVTFTDNIIREISQNASYASFNYLPKLLKTRQDGGFGEVIRRWASNKAFQDMGIKDFDKNYNQYMSIEDFEHFYDTANTSTGFIPNMEFDTSQIPQQIQSSIESGGPYTVNIEVEDPTTLSNSIRSSIEFGEPYYVKTELDPSALIDLSSQIQSSLENKTYKVNVEVNQISVEKTDNGVITEEPIEKDVVINSKIEQPKEQTSEDVISKETSSFDELKKKLISDIPDAVDVKTRAFESEQIEVDTFIQLEINKLEELSNKLREVFKNVDTPEELKNFFESINNLKFSDKNIENIKKLQEAISELINKIQELNSGDFQSDGILSSISQLVSHAEELQNLATILSSSKEKIDGVISGTNSPSSDSEQAIENYRELMSHVQDYHNLLQKVQSAGVGSLSDDEFARYNEYKQMLEQADATAQKYNGTIKELTEAQDRYNQRIKSVIEHEQKLSDERQKKLIEDNIKKTDTRLDRISEYNKQRWTDQYTGLKEAISKANESFRNTGDIEAYNQAVRDAFGSFEQFSKMPNGKPIEQMFGSMGEAKQYFENIVNSYKTVVKGVSGSTSLDANGLAQWSATVRDAEGNVQKLTASWKDGVNQMVIASQQLPKQLVGLPGIIDGIKSKLGQLAKYWTARLFDPYRLIRYVKQVINVVKEYDSAMMEIRKVSQATSKEFENIKMSSFDVGREIGATGKDVLSSVAAWKRIGKSLEESQEAARASNWLLNVSEFTNIDDATKSLVSITQAFKDLSYESAIDKLNGVGDAFSSSTDQIASGMQNVASVLQVAGNDVDQSIALLAAANDVTQDMSKASMGVRTVALRIAGTQEAKEQLEELGEDTSDFIVQTTSKVDQQVRNYTKTAKNPTGISVLDDKGRLRDTYSILLDISKVWSEIVEKDNQFGTNTSNALLELLAGKTRSNVLASILQAPEILENAYETSKSSAGVGQRELDIYLDSIQAKTTQLTNSLQELANITINSESFKTLLDIINQLLSGVNALAKQFGAINTIIGGVVGFTMQRSGLGILNYDKERGFTSVLNGTAKKNDKETSPTKLSMLERLRGRMNPDRAYKEGQKSTQQQQETVTATANVQPELNVDKDAIGDSIVESTVDAVNEVSERLDNEVSNAFPEISPSGTIIDTTGIKDNLQEVVEATSDLKDSSQEVTTTTQQTAGAMEELGNAAVSASGKVQQMSGNLISSLTSLVDIKTLILKFSSMIVNMVVAMVAQAAIKAVADGIHYIIHETQIIIDKGKEAKETIDDIYSTFDEKNSNIKDIATELFGEDKTRTTQQSIEKLADKYDKLHDSVNDVTNENVSLTNDDYEQYLSLCNQIAEQFPSLVKGYDNQGNAILTLGDRADSTRAKLSELLAIQQTSSNIEIGGSLNDVYAGLKKEETQLKSQIGEDIAELNRLQNSSQFVEVQSGSQLVQVAPAHVNDVQKYIQENFEGVYLDANSKRFNESTKMFELLFNGLDLVSDEDVQTINEYIASLYDVGQATEEVLSGKSAKELKLNDLWSSLTGSIGKYLQTSKSFTGLNENIQNAILGNLANIDTSKISDIYEDDVLDFIYGELIEPLSNLSEQDQIDLSELFKIDIQGSTLKDYREKVKTGLQSIFGDNADDFYKLFGFEEIANSYDAIITKLINQFGDSTAITNLSGKELDIASQLMDSEYFDSWDKLYEAIQKKLKEKTEDVKDGVLGDLFNDSDYQEVAEKSEKALSSLTGALEKIRTEGELTNEEIGDLIEEFPNLFKSFDDVNEETIGVAAFEELNKWITLIRDNIDDTWTDDAIKAAETYIQTLQMQFGDFGVTADQVRDKIKEMIINPAEGSEASIARANTLTKAFEEAGLEENPEIVASFIADPSNLEGTTSDIISRFQDFVLNWHIYMDKKEVDAEVAKIERGVADRNARRGALDQARAYSEETGRSLGAIANDANANITKKKTLWERAKKENGVTSKEAKDALEELDNAYIEMYAAVSNMDFGEEIAIDQANVDAKRAEFGKQYEYYFNNLQNWADDDPQKSVAYQAMETARQEYFSALITQQQTFDTKDQENIRGYTDAINDSQTEVTKLQDEIEKANNSGKRVSRETYDALSQEYSEQAEQQRGLAEYWDGVANDATRSIADQKAARKNAAEALAEATSLDKQAQETSRQFDTDTLTEYQNKYADMQTEATQLEEGIAQAEAKHQKVSAKMYQNLIDNGRKQVDNLKDQKDTLQTLQKQVARNSTEWRDYQSQIDSIDSSISSMQNNQLGWFETMTSLVSTNASELASALSSAFSEINSETGLTIDTMNELERQFSDIAGYDVSKIFYESSDGMKLNAKAAEDLVDAEYELQQSNLRDEIERQNRIIEAQSKLHTADAQSAIDAANKKIDAANRELSMLQALYDQQKKNFTDFQRWQDAQSTENAGDRYTTIQSSIKDIKEAYKNGLTGTDEFRAFTQMIDQWGLDTVDAYERSISKIERYFTEDRTGLSNFFKDAVEAGYGTMDENGFVSLAIPDVEQAAKDMHITSELMDILLGRAEDYGAYNDWVSSRLDGEEKLKENMQKLVEAQLKYNEVVREGAPQDVIDEAQKEVADLERRRRNLLQGIEDVTSREGAVSASDLRAGVEDFLTLKKQFQAGLIDRDTFEANAQAIANDTHIILKDFEIDTEAMNEAYPDYQRVDTKLDFSGVETQYDGEIEKLRNKWKELQDTADALAQEGGKKAVAAQQAADQAYTEWQSKVSEKDQYVSLGDKLEQNRGALEDYFEVLKGVKPEDIDKLDAITLSNGTYDVDGDLTKAEDALQGIADTLGLGAEEASLLVSLLKEINLFNQPESTYEVPEPKSAFNESSKDNSAYANVARDRQVAGGYQSTETITQIVRTEYENGTLTPDEIQAMDQQTFETTFGVTVTGDEQLQEVKDNIAEITGTDGFDFVVKLDQSTIDALTSTDKTVNVNTEDAQTAVSDLKTQMEDLNNVEDPHVGADTANATMKLAQVSSQLTTIQNQNPSPTVNIAGNYEQANVTLSALARTILGLQSKTITVTTIKRETQASGTAHAAGTVLGMWNDYRYSIGAWASGSNKDWRLPQNEDALVNEIGQESIVRDGRWFTIPGGPHVEKLKRGDIIFNAEQTEDLIRTGRTTRNGKLVPSYARGSVTNGMPAFSATRTGWDTQHATDETKKTMSGLGSDVKKASNTIKDNSGKVEKASNKLDDLKKWLGNLVDWVDNRIDKLTTAIERFEKAADNAVGYKEKNKQIGNAMDTLSDDKTYKLATEEGLLYTNKKGKLAVRKGGKNNTLLYDTARGAVKYQNEADTIAKKFLKAGTFKRNEKDSSKKQEKYMNDIIKKIKNGTIDIKEYKNENVREFISQYEEWYGKSQDLVSSTQDLVAQYKELEQTKLDNIVDQFESLQSYAESVSKVSQSMISLNNTAGKTSYSSTNKEEFKKQIGQQNLITKYIEQEQDAYKNEMDKAAKIFGTDSNEYRAAQTAYEGMNAALYESKENAIALKRELLDLNTKPFDYSIERLKEWATDLAGIVSLKQARGTMKGDASTMINEWDYSDQIRAANNQIAKLSGRIATNWAIIDEMGYDIDSDQYRELEAAIRADEQAINDLKISNEQLKDSIVELRWKPFEDLQKKTKEAISDFDHLRGLLNSEGFFDQNGEGWNLTEEGYANLALLGAQIQKTNTQIADYRKALDKVNEEYNNGNISLEEYEEKSRNMVDIIQDLVDSNENYKDSIVELYKTQITNEANALQELIDKRSEALSSKKA